MESYIRNGGSDLGAAIAKEREDMIYLDAETADLKIGKLCVHMHHGSGGKPYSLTYKLQRYVETLPLDRPIHIVAMGHYHSSGYLRYLDKHCFQVGSLIDPTPFSRQMGLRNEVSVWWLDVKMDDKGNVHSIIPELECFDGKKLTKNRK